MADATKTPVGEMDITSTLDAVALSELGAPTNPEPVAPDPVVADPVAPVAPDPVVADPASPAKPASPLLDIPTLPEPAPTVKPEDDDIENIDLEQVDEKIRPNLAKMRDKLKGQTKDIATITAERDDLRTQLAATSETEVAKAFAVKEAELHDTISKLSLEADPRFVQKYRAQSQPLFETLIATVSSYAAEGVDASNAVQRAMSMAPRDRAEYLKTVLAADSETALVTLLPTFSQLDVIGNARTAELQNHKIVMAEMGQVDSQKSIDDLKALRTEAKTTAIASARDKEPLFRKVEGNEGWNTTVAALETSVDAIFETDDPAVHAAALVESRTAPIYKQGFLAERTERKRLEAVLKERGIVVPNVGTSPAPASPALTGKLEDLTPDSVAKSIANTLPA